MAQAVPNDRWIILRGLTREVAHWGEFAATLGAALRGAQIVPLELPGAGELRDRPWPGDVATAMEDVRARAGHAPAGTRTFVFGMSLGGMLTMEWAARHPGELGGVVVGASSARDLSRPWQRMKPAALPAVLGARVRKDVAAREAAIVRTVTNRADRWPDVSTRWADIARERPITGAAARGQLLAAMRWSAPRSIAVPSLFIVGTTDKLVDASCSRALARRYGAPLVEHPTAGHDISTDEPEWLSAQIARWRDSLGSGPDV
jgi:pimeloyl-ACP methyl ester carboxylesterase